ncbi:MAG TPA: TlpA disulfide reductase family protein, partial [Gemmataceae bacterium]|nr:TlpA disulfide reductase family protein [Gemmataceae bacterium]
VRVNATAGGAITANIGGNGRPVAGRITTADGGELENANPTSASLAQRDPDKDRGDGKDAEPKTTPQTIILNIGEDGRFRVEEVAPGPYTLTAQIFSKIGQMLGRVEQEIVVPEIPGGRTSEVLDLPPIALVPFDDLDVGEEAPEIVAEQVTGEPFKLSDLRGRFVLLDFWATWCGPCIAEMPTLKSVHEKYEDRDDFIVVSMSVDAERETAADFIKRQKLDWTQVFLGEWSSSPYPTKYGVFGIPAIFLIGPDGRVLAKNLRDEKLKEEVAKALDAVAAKESGEAKKEP